MASSFSKVAMVYLALILSLLVASMSETGQVGFSPTNPTLECDEPYGVQVGDTCFSIQNAKKLSSDFFSFINPNLNCSGIFVGQWLCTFGKVN